MVWARLDDQVLDNPKIARAGVLGFALHVAAITWCCRNLTDGFVPHGRVACLLDLDIVDEYVELIPQTPPAFRDKLRGQMRSTGSVDPRLIAEKLVEIGLWIEVAGGYELHDFLVYNPSREKVLAERQRAKGKYERSGKGGSSAGVSKGVSAGESTETPRALRRSLAGSSDGPDPDPVKRRKEDLSSSSKSTIREREGEPTEAEQVAAEDPDPPLTPEENAAYAKRNLEDLERRRAEREARGEPPPFTLPARVGGKP